MKNRILDSLFIKWMSEKDLEIHFNYLKNFLEDSDIDIEIFLNNFLIKPQKKSKLKELNISNFYFKDFKTIDDFNNHFKNENFFDLNQIKLIFSNFFQIHTILHFNLLKLLDINFIETKNYRISQKNLINFFNKFLFNKSIIDINLLIITANEKSNYISFNDLTPIIYTNILMDNQFKELHKNQNLLSRFVDYLLINFFFWNDHENKKLIFKNDFNINKFYESITFNKNFENFKAIFKLYKLLILKNFNYLTINDLFNYNNFRIPKILLERLINLIKNNKNSKKISFLEFCLFLMYIEEKNSLSSLNIWFKVCDLDDNGFLSFYELEKIIKLQEENLKFHNLEIEKFNNIINQILDLINNKSNCIYLFDLKNSFNWGNFFNILIDYKYFDYYENLDPIYNYISIGDIKNFSKWEEFCNFLISQ